MFALVYHTYFMHLCILQFLCSFALLRVCALVYSPDFFFFCTIGLKKNLIVCLLLYILKFLCSCFFFRESALWANAFYKSICPYVCVSVCLSVCLCVCSLLRYCLNVFLPPLPKVGCPIILEIQNPLGKIMEGSGLRVFKKIL